MRCDSKVHEKSEEDRYYDWLTVGAIRLPSQDIEIFPKKHKIKQTTISNFRIECHLFRNAKSFEKQNIKKMPSPTNRKREYPILKLAYKKTSSLLRPEKNTLRRRYCSPAAGRQETQGDVRTEHRSSPAQREWTRSYGGVVFLV